MISLSIIVMVIFAMFKISGLIAWSWFWVVSPIIVAVLLELLVTLLLIWEFGGTLRGTFGRWV